MGSCAISKQKQVVPISTEFEPIYEDIIKVDVSTLVKPEDLNLPSRRRFSSNVSDKLSYKEDSSKVSSRPRFVPLLDIKKLFPQNQLSSEQIDLKKQAWNLSKQKGDRNLLQNASKDNSFSSSENSSTKTQSSKSRNLIELIKNTKSTTQSSDEKNSSRMDASQAILENSWIETSLPEKETKIEVKKLFSPERKLLSFPSLNYQSRSNHRIQLISQQDCIVAEESEFISDTSDESPIRPDLQTPGSSLSMEFPNNKFRKTFSRISTMKLESDQSPINSNINELRLTEESIERTKWNLLASL
ncbi:unnamed protein product [Blepharisma stoltei]|uniref:Exophilin 5 n=1 Tax=Blepharisma stoltei TaxID=1481888 RepID=A0AAU9K8V3_9CILI|nr:unnamed protein product [Blepharisma stoltei]